MEQPPASQYSAPSGEEGRSVMIRMNEHHAPLWDEALARLPKVVEGAVLDVGCGGGGLLGRLALRYPYAMLFGVDVSVDALNFTAELNSGVVNEGGLELVLASVDRMPFGDGSFDIVTAVETYFFWPDLEAGLREIARVMSPGGVLMVASELSYSTTERSVVDGLCEEHGMAVVEDSEMLRLMDGAGFDAQVFHVGHGVLYRGVRRF